MSICLVQIRKKKGLLPGSDRSSSKIMRSWMHTPNALSLGDRVMVMQDDAVLFHALAKVAIIPGNPREIAKNF
ncbi:MAG: hypothetical protein IKM75_00375 [Bacteroidales bacterium]|nr:hypothetical protein [Bacteroidales bacterium]